MTRPTHDSYPDDAVAGPGMVDTRVPAEEQIRRQGKIIDALMRKAGGQKNMGPAAYQAFQSAIALQQTVAAQTLELESARFERERSRRTLEEALNAMEEGFALFSDGQLDVCNALFLDLLPDISDQMVAGLSLSRYFELVAGSEHLISTDQRLDGLARTLSRPPAGPEPRSAVVSLIAELSRDRWFQLSVQRVPPESTVLLFTEITTLVQHNRREKEHLIDRQADYLRAVFQNMSAGMCSFSGDGEVRMHNARFRDLLGLPMFVLQPGTSLTNLLDYMKGRGLIQDDGLLQVAAWRQELDREGWLIRRVNHGVDRVLDLHANMLPDGGVLVEVKDVTLEVRSTETLENRVMARTAELTEANDRLTRQYEEKAQVEEELRLAKERAEAAVSSKTRFLAAASHDLLQPINAAKLLISTLQETTRATRFRPMVERLEGAFSSAEYLLHSLLDISRLESADLDTVSPSDVHLDVVMNRVMDDQMLLAAQKSVRLDVVFCSLVVCSDPVYLLRSVQNLVVNAILYTEPGGRVLVGCRRKPGGRVALEVWDTGIGIARKDQARIFDEFTRAGNVPLGAGVGLGLSVVDRACRLLDHDLRVRSAPGRGSVFTIEMDVVEGALREQVSPLSALPNIDVELDGHIVLVIENDPDVLYGTTQWLELCGASVLAAASSEEAVSLVDDMGIPPDIILADYQLDGTDTGIRAITEIRTRTGSHVPAMLITADRSKQVERLGAAHDVAVLPKPVELPRLRALINWKIRRDDNENPVAPRRRPRLSLVEPGPSNTDESRR
ncbi:MAG: PAS-domain containing protein [Sulfitobacter sp.]